jgi:hypothetical protein
MPNRIDAFGLVRSEVCSAGRSIDDALDDPVKVVPWLHTPVISVR